MAKTKPKKGKQNKKAKNGKKSQVVQRVGTGTVVPRALGGLDKYGKAHAMMLADPCRAPLEPGVYPGSGGGVIFRFVQDQILFNDFSTTNVGAFVWCPGYAAYSQSIDPNGLQTDTSTFNMSVLKPAAGNAFCANAQSYRCLAGCVQVYYPGTELTWQGYVGLGYGSGAGLITDFQTAANGGDGNTTSIAALRQTQFHVERTPNTFVELRWKPNQDDAVWVSGLSAANQVATNAYGMSGRNCISVTASGIAPGVGLRIRTIGIYEVILQPGSGIVGTVANAAPSKNTLNDVLRVLDTAGNWFLSTATKYGPEILSAIGYGATLLA